jgi:hypothetical protein
MIKLNNSKNYAKIIGGLLFILGILGFAFRTSSSTPDYALIAAIVLGFWGVIVGFKK